MRPTSARFEIGDRVCLSALGESRMRRTPSKAGKVVGFGFSGTRIRVLFDGLSRPTTLHHSYLKNERELEESAEGPVGSEPMRRANR
jgi:hypothetical protein